MTTASPTFPVCSPGPAAVRAALADAEVRRRIEGIVKRRVQPGDVEDVVQQVVCDALGSDLVPDDPADVPRWLFGITRHKSPTITVRRAAASGSRSIPRRSPVAPRRSRPARCCAA
jgi:DNA-directed RNA polymerase specialized sigma24 family protein